MGKPVAGEVVVLPFPQTNLQSGKRRPALVVAELVGDDLVLCQITRRARTDGYSIPLGLADFERGRLAVDSFIRANRLFTVDQSVILYAAGPLSRNSSGALVGERGNAVAKMKEPETKERKFENVVKSAEQAAALVLVY